MDSLFENIPTGNRCSFWKTEVAWFPKMKAPRPERRVLFEIVEDIRQERWRSQIKHLRALLERGEKATYNREKIRLPSFFASGCALNPSKMQSHSGAVQVDLDCLGSRLAVLRTNLVKEPSLAALFLSPSGHGLKLIFRIAELSNPLDKAEHRGAVNALYSHLSESYELKPDPSYKNVNRHCLISADASLYLNPDPTPFDWRWYSGSSGGRERESSSVKTPLLQSSNTAVLQCYDTTPQSEPCSRVPDTRRKLAAIGFRRDIEKKFPEQWELYQVLVERRREARSGERNKEIVRTVPFLYRAVSVEIVRLFMEWFYRANESFFHDPIEVHMKEVDAVLAAVESSYAAELSLTEREFWNVLGKRNRDAFRICRDLAFREEAKELPPPIFYLSQDTLARRLGLFKASGDPQGEAAGRILRLFTDFAIIGVHLPGLKRAPGNFGRATQFKWLLPTPGKNQPACGDSAVGIDS